MKVSISGTIVSDNDKWLYDWFGIPATSPADIRKAISENPAGETLTVAINSGGGDVFAGFEMYTMLRQAQCHTVAEVESLAASAASTAMIGCDEVLLSPVAQVMIHLPACTTRGNENDHRESLEALESILVSILNGYELRCRGKADRAQLEQWTRSSTWMPVQDAIALGLADGVLGESEGLSMDVRITNATSGFLGGLQTPTAPALLDEYRRRVAAGAVPAEGHELGFTPTPTGAEPENADMSWRDKAALALEKEKFKFI